MKPQAIPAFGLLLFLVAGGCRESKRPAPTGPASSAEESPPASAQATTAAATSTGPAGTTISPAGFHPVLLDDFYQRQFVDYRPTESWAQVPRGETNFDGVPFLMVGKIDLAGLGRARDGEFQPARVGQIPVGRRAARVHLVHGASYDAPDDTPIACLLLRYESGETRRLFIRYGRHARNWYVEANEVDPTLIDPRSLVVWNGHARPDGVGTPTRLFKTTFDNPLPAQPIRAIELLSLFARANSVILAVTLEDASGPPPAAASASADEDDSEFRREDTLSVVDADAGQPIPNVSLRLTVTEGARTYRFGVYRSDAGGQIRVSYPPGKFQRFLAETTAPGYLPLNTEMASEAGLLGPDRRIPLKREAAAERQP